MFIENCPATTLFRRFTCITLVALGAVHYNAAAHDISFCGELIPVNNDFVAEKLMNVIRAQIPNVNMLALRQRAFKYFPVVEEYLRKNNIPDDFKYLPIVESGFANLTSRVGAHGFWQLMPETARQFNLIVSPSLDEREDILKSTGAACKFILQTYNIIKNRSSVPSWVLTAAAYNFGPGNVMKAVKKQGTDYFAMTLNHETAEYVYKIIAVKELFENPELYMRGFGVNVFRKNAVTTSIVTVTPAVVKAQFSTLDIKVTEPGKPVKKKNLIYSYVVAHIVARKKIFQDGDLVTFQLDNDMRMRSSFIAKKSTVQGTGWMIDGRIYVDMGYGHNVQVFDNNSVKGISETDVLKDNQPVRLKVVSGEL